MKKKSIIDEIKRFWGDVVNNEEVSIQHRLKASELLLKVTDETENEAVKICGEEELED